MHHDRLAHKSLLYVLHLVLWKVLWRVTTGRYWDSIEICLLPNVLLLLTAGVQLPAYIAGSRMYRILLRSHESASQTTQVAWGHSQDIKGLGMTPNSCRSSFMVSRKNEAVCARL